MKTWRRPSLAMVALLALLASFVPQFAWACPMTGRVAVAAMVCESSFRIGVASEAVAPCAGSGSKCCHPVSLPLNAGDEKSHPTLNAVSVQSAAFLTAPHHAPVENLIVFATVTTETAPALRVWLARFTNSPPVRLTRYRPAALAGRAPPVL